ncbi:protein O-mannosyl-transferase family, partial [Promineifilum sp.]|uniref:protein O-mannosyl-transferase family n=1 Tax=Promineifilum sp. TaxID=2664178 RepID=UPI0035AF7A51
MSRWLHYLPGMALGLFLARLGGEWVGLPGWWAAALLGLALAAAGAWLLARWPLRRTWPALVLLVYVVYPEVNTGLAAWLALLAVVTSVARDSYPASSPGPRDKNPVPRWPLVETALFLAFLALYALNLAPDVLAADSGELQVVAAQLGVAHPPGFPLYVMLAHLFTRLPFDSPAYAVNLLSAVAAALTVALTYRVGLVLTGRRLPALLGAAALGTATTFWSQATTANVRSLTALFAALILLALLHFRAATARGDGRRAGRWLVAAALFMGFGLTHHVSLAFLILVGLLFVLVVDRGLWRQPRRWLPAAGAGLLGLLPLLYLPWRAAADVRGASPDLATLSGFLEHVLATGFRGDLFYFTAPALLWERLRVMGNVMTFQFAPLLLAGMALGLLALLRRDRAAALLLGGAFVVYTLIAATYRAPQTVEYMMPAYVPAALCLAYAGAEARWLSGAGRLWAVAGPLFTALMFVAVLHQGFGHVSASGARHEGTSARDYAASLLASAPPDSVVLAHWHWATPLWYLQGVEGQRPDVDVRFVFPEGEPYDATWARRTTEAFA